MPNVEHEAFVDLEHALSDRLTDVFVSAVRPLTDKIVAAVEAQQLDKAHELVDKLDAGKALIGQRTYVRNVLHAATLMGAKSVRPDVTDAGVFKKPNKAVLDSAAAQLISLVENNATLQVKNSAHRAINKVDAFLIELRERQYTVKAEIPEIPVPKVSRGKFADMANNVRVRINRGGKSMLSLGSSSYVSRMRSYGMLSEMPASATYQVQAILDERTSEICQFMHGKTFTAADGLSMIESGLNSTSPDVWKGIAPYRSKGKGNMPFAHEDLSAQGLQAPPYHPLCRSIVVPVGRLEVVSFEDSTDELAMNLTRAAAKEDKHTTQVIRELAEQVGAKFPDALPFPAPEGLAPITDGSVKFFRLKDFKSTRKKMFKKIGDPDNPLTAVQAAESIGDSLRYTYVMPADDYVAGVRRTVDALKKRGYKIIEVENIWGKRPDYKGVHISMQPPKIKNVPGKPPIVELQIHTANSYNTKQNIAHPMYEKVKNLTNDDPIKIAAKKKMAEASSKVPFPPGVSELDELEKIYNKGKVKPKPPVVPQKMSPNQLLKAWDDELANINKDIRRIDGRLRELSGKPEYLDEIMTLRKEYSLTLDEKTVIEALKNRLKSNFDDLPSWLESTLSTFTEIAQQSSARDALTVAANEFSWRTKTTYAIHEWAFANKFGAKGLVPSSLRASTGFPTGFYKNYELSDRLLLAMSVRTRIHRAALRAQHPSGKITLYRGLARQNADALRKTGAKFGDNVDYTELQLSSWTTEYGVAEDFAWNKAWVLKAEISIDDILFDGRQGNILKKLPAENELVVINRKGRIRAQLTLEEIDD